MQESDVVIGIDLGTTYSCVAFQRNGTVEIIPNDQGSRTTPSWVSFTDTERLVGQSAQDAFTTNPRNTVFDVKRLLGQTMDDEDLRRDVAHLPFAVVQGEDGKPAINVRHKGKDRQFSPEEISGMVLVKMKETAEAHLGHKVSKAVVTVPAYFNDAQRQATKDAGTIAGLEVLRVINEPTAAAIAYGLDTKHEETKVLVYDLGGGTFDVSLLDIDDGVFEVLATAGDTHLGGEDFDERVMAWVTGVIAGRSGVPASRIREDIDTMSQLRREVERAKRVLSTEEITTVEIGGWSFDEPLTHSTVQLTRAKFEELNRDLFERTMRPVDRVLADTGVKRGEIDEIVLVGGSTRIPRIRQMLTDYFGREPVKGVNPDEAVAYGAAIQGGILSGDDSISLTIIDVTPLTYGIETSGGVFTKLIARNTIIPTRKSQIFSTAADNQPTVRIRAYEGERALTAHNHPLGEFELTGIPPAPRGVPQIKVLFDIDADGILQVSAEDMATGRAQKITVTNVRDRLTQEEVYRMLTEAEDMANEDKAQLKRVETLNTLSGFTHDVKQRVLGPEWIRGRLNADEKAILKRAVDDVDDWIAQRGPGADMEAIEAKLVDIEGTVAAITNKIHHDGGHERRDSEEDGWSHIEL